mmetsp:Transcript_57327/g.90907  ORF Transcript_57327/g.90907 Transcript_57327/m.90907 type:complete len:103 (+) Transcript_57327:804-1112(+)
MYCSFWFQVAISSVCQSTFDYPASMSDPWPSRPVQIQLGLTVNHPTHQSRYKTSCEPDDDANSDIRATPSETPSLFAFAWSMLHFVRHHDGNSCQGSKSCTF